MPGRSGAARVTLQNVEVVQVRDQEHLLMIKGGLPGARNSLVMIRKAIKKSN
jgi:large subunit ribosomal protein L3